MSHDLAPGATLVLDLLSYIEQVEKLKSKPAFSVPTEFFVAYQHELRTLPGIQFNLQSDGDDIWLRIPRLREIAPPEPEDVLRPWIILPKNPEKVIRVAENPELNALHGNKPQNKYTAKLRCPPALPKRAPKMPEKIIVKITIITAGLIIAQPMPINEPL